MPLTNKAYLVLDNTSQFGDEGVFELTGVEVTEELDREMLLGNRGQVITGISDVVPILPEFGSDGSGINIDGGAGRDVITIEAEITKPEGGINSGPTWGAQNSGLPANAQGRHPVTQAQVLKNWARTTKTDSFRAGKLHWGEWTDGRFDDELGAFGEPIPVVVQSVRLTHPRDDPSASTASIEVLRTSEVPDTDDLRDDIGDFFDDLI